MSYGMDSRIGISFQNSFGTELTNSVYWIPAISESLSVGKPPLISQGMRGIYDEGEHFEGANEVGGEIETEAEAIPLGAMLQTFFGAPATVTSDAVQTHLFKPAQADFDAVSAKTPITAHRYLGVGSAELFYDLNASTIELNVANGEFLGAKIGFVGGKFKQSVALAASYENGKRFTWDQTSASIGGAATCKLSQLTYTVDEALEGMHTLCSSKEVSRVKRTAFRTVTIAGTLKFDDTDEYDKFLAQEERELIASWRGTTEVQSGYFEELTIKLPLFRHTEFAPNAAGPGEIEVGFTGKGVYSVTSASAMEVTLVNTQAAY